MRDYLFNTGKIKYVKGDKPAVECILCAIRDGSPEVKDLTVYRGDSFIVAVNLFPFNPGHLMIFPRRHVTELRGLSEPEALDTPQTDREDHRHTEGRIQPGRIQRGIQPGKRKRRQHPPCARPYRPPVRERGGFPGRAGRHAGDRVGPGRGPGQAYGQVRVNDALIPRSRRALPCLHG